MFNVHHIHHHKRDKIDHEMTDNQNFYIGIFFIKHRESNSDKKRNNDLSYSTITTVENSE